MAFNNRTGNGKRLNNVRIDRALTKPFDVFELTCFFFKNIDKVFEEYIKWLEELTLQYPYEWYNFYRFWQ